MNDQGLSTEGVDIFAVDASWPASRQVMGHGYDEVTGDVHVSLWFGSPHFDLQAEHVTVVSASSGNAEAGVVLERALGIYYGLGEESLDGLPASESVTLTTDGNPTTFELWRNSVNRCWVARGRVESTEVVLSGSEIEPGELTLVRVSDLTSFTNPFESLR
ncbi:hypothetical protein PV755_36185 [Streptomyces caniscabiei]|uniref:Uncharacterized protein n=1 Tax=Streptomyces caniscabiei TaxID=2746961 RepID=A0A927KZN8_9ACTN|nr:hypothetical protein [Streptomyces caniscabiei]MBD9722358.1 hypothetical protein [Streptomyces caniscabiei]MDX3514284.1 hypothetical protein [Streptomyces caniscabiei]MDX3716690.1 hypothetical protein [Streptomyces caniscabiei]WEO22577.1 hypothetical protein IHE65_05140 [Streptomyces caniscabiei]